MRTIKELLEDYRKKLQDLYNLPLTPDRDLRSLDTNIRNEILSKLIFMTRARPFAEPKERTADEDRVDTSAIRANDVDCVRIFNGLQEFFKKNYGKWFLTCRPWVGPDYKRWSDFSIKICELVSEMSEFYFLINNNQVLDRLAEERRELIAYQSQKESEVVELQRALTYETTQAAGTLSVINKMVDLVPVQDRSKITELIVEKKGDKTTTTINIMDEILFHDYVAEENKYLTKVVPQEQSIKRNPVKCAKECSSFVLSNRRAASVFLLMRYLFKLKGITIDNKHTGKGLEYFKESQKLEQEKINIEFYIAICALFLFMEFDKDWKSIISTPNPATRLLKLAKEYNLVLLQEKLKKIVGIPKQENSNHDDEKELLRPIKKAKHIDINELVDIPALDDKNRCVYGDTDRSIYYNTGKIVYMFFAHNNLFADQQYEPFKKISHMLYQRGRKADDPTEDLRDHAALEKIYALGPK